MSKANRSSTLPVGPTQWDAVLRRDRRADGEFFFGVRSTGVYCRPSCPARRPRKENAVFFRTPADAENAGFRACRRCRPAELSAATELAGKAARWMAQMEVEELSVSRVAGQFGVSSAKLRRAFQQATGLSPKEFLAALRMEQFRKALRSGQKPAEALYACGFGSPSRIYEKSDAHLGMTPGTYRRGGAGMEIEYGIAETSLGKVLMAMTSRGVSAVYLGASEDELVAELKKEYPRASIHRMEAASHAWLRELVHRVEGDAPNLELPFDVVATAFQRRVWQELQKIPAGATKTYTQVARALGDPKAVRAVARACATNPVSIVVPCHRVVRQDGNLAGYRWGLSRKKQLLERESRQPARGPRI